MDLMLFLVLVFSKTLVISHCLPAQDYSLSPVQLAAPKSSTQASTESARAAVISKALLSLLRDTPDSDDNKDLPSPVTEDSFSSLIKDLPVKNSVSLNQDAETDSVFTTDQNSVLGPEKVLTNPVLPVSKKQKKKISLPSETVDSFNDFTSWLHKLLTQAEKKTKEEEKKKEEDKEEKEEDKIIDTPTEKVENFKSWLQKVVAEAKERNENTKSKVEEMKQKLVLQKEKLDDLSNFRSWLQDAVTIVKESNEKEKAEEEEKQKSDLPADTAEGFSNFRSWLQDSITLAKEEKDEGEKEQKIGLPTETVEGLNNMRSKLQEVLMVVKTKKQEEEKEKEKPEREEKVRGEKEERQETEKSTNTTTAPVGETVMCFLCTTVMNEMKHAMDNPDMERNMQDALENGMCPFIPEGLDCKTKVRTYCPVLFQMIHQEMDPETFCQDMTLCQDNASPQAGAVAVLDFMQRVSESRNVPHATPKPTAQVSAQKSLADFLKQSAQFLKPSIAAALSRASAEAPLQTPALHSVEHAAESPKQSPQASTHRSLLDILKPDAESPKTPALSSPSAEVFVKNAIHSLLEKLVSSQANSDPTDDDNSQANSDPTDDDNSQANSDPTDDDNSAVSSESPLAASLVQPAPDSTDLPAHPTKPFDPDSAAQLPPPSGNLLELVSSYLCRSHGLCGGGSQGEAHESGMGKQEAERGRAEEDDTALRFLPNAQQSQEKDPASFTISAYDTV